MKYEITEEQIYQIHSVLHDGNTPIFNKQNLEKLFPDAFKNEAVLFTGWMKDDRYPKWINYFKDGIIQYGIDWVGNWIQYDKKEVSKDNFNRVATEEEVKEALTKEAVKRYSTGDFIDGFFIGISHNNLKNEFKKVDSFDMKDNELWYEGIPCSGVIFKNGIWAKIIQTITKSEAEKELGKKIIN